jgi:hypothetical protein
MQKPKDNLEYGEAVEELAQLVTGESHYTGTFLDFLRDIFKYSYDNFEVPWYLELLAKEVERAWREGKRFLAVLPRMHSKSVSLGYALSCWFMITLGNCSIMYTSYRDEQARFHCAEIKRAIRRNPILREWLIDLAPEAEVVARYRVKGGGIAQVYVGGIFSAKRGYHCDLVVADDVLSDPSNPLTYVQLRKVESHFYRELANIPKRDGMLVVVGTPMAPGDLLHNLYKNPEYISYWLPALNPNEEHNVLWETKYPREWLDRKRIETGEHSFRAEYLLYPAITTEAYFLKGELDKVIDPTLKNYSIFSPPEVASEVFGGFDVGKKRHPSSLTLLLKQGGHLEQIHQSFLDDMDYTDQVTYITGALKSFNVRLLYIDNTRGELEERGLPRYQCRFVTFGIRSGAVARAKGELAAKLERRVNQRRIGLLQDDRFIAQLLSVDNSLRSPDSSIGHGDAFTSLMLAVAAHDEVYPEGEGESYLVGDMARVVELGIISYNTSDTCPKCGSKATLEFSNDSGRCSKEEATSAWCLQCGDKWKICEGEWIVTGNKPTIPTLGQTVFRGTWRTVW